ncbi:MAG: hypothetical protein HXY30_16145, partial [Pseudorhodoplanes sp.]|nr:hypothetical protein [Pseudorhodoplanes sp.]
MTFDKFTRTMQIIAAALAIPAGAAGLYSAYRMHFTNEAACEKLREAILSTMEKNLVADTKHQLLRRDVGNFEKACGEVDPDTGAIFTASLQQLEIEMAGKSLRQAAVQAAPQPEAQPPAKSDPQSQPQPAQAARPNPPQARPAQSEPREARLAQAGAPVPASLPRPQLP